MLPHSSCINPIGAFFTPPGSSHTLKFFGLLSGFHDLPRFFFFRFLEEQNFHNNFCNWNPSDAQNVSNDLGNVFLPANVDLTPAIIFLFDIACSMLDFFAK